MTADRRRTTDKAGGDKTGGGIPAEVRRRAEEYRADIARFLRDIVAIPSPSCQEGRVVDRILEEMRRVGFDEAYRDEVGNAVGRVGSGPTVIIYDGHIDTVGIGDPTAWEHDPFQGKVEDGRIYGLGAVDEKAAVAAMVHGARIIKELGLDQDYTLYVVGTVQEEDCDGLAAGRFVEHLKARTGRRPDLAVLGEPTDLQIYRGHRGRCEMKVIVKGRACHGSAPERGDNAVYKMGQVLEGIQRLAPRLKDDPFLGRGSIAVTRIESRSGSLNVVPDECTIYIDRRMTWGETPQSSLDEVRAIVAGLGEPDPPGKGPRLGAVGAEVALLEYDTKSHTGYPTRMPKEYPTWVTPEDHPAVIAGVRAAEELFGARPPLGRWVFSTDGVALAGVHGIPTIGYAPGNEVLAHTVRECVAEDQLVKAAAFYAWFPSVAAEELRKDRSAAE
ncbi:MAG: YgeY family selenium metabolism-linked hydrolase [Bacillota bacterium]